MSVNVGFFFLLTCKKSRHHGGVQNKDQVEEDHAGIIVYSTGIVPDLPIQQANEDGNTNVKSKPHRRQDLFKITTLTGYFDYPLLNLQLNYRAPPAWYND